MTPIDSGNTAWMLIATALVLLMIPGLALFYGGMTRQKNVLSTMNQSFIVMSVITLQWVLFGYSLSFGEGNGFIGDFSLAGVEMLFHKVEPNGYPTILFVVFQGMFAAITPALISGAIAERIKFLPYVLFIVLWSTLVYDPICHWVWADKGWLLADKALDFAGGTVVHMSSGFAALAAIIILGKRRGYGEKIMRPHNLTMTLLGTGLLWFGWFGFNAGSGLKADALAGQAFAVTNISAAAAALSWLLCEVLHFGKATALGFASGAVAGLVGITPAAGSVGILGAIAIGLITGAVCYFAVAFLKEKFGYDDSLDAFGVHGVGGTIGAILTGVFAFTGVLEGNGYTRLEQVLVQLKGAAATAIYSFLVTLVLVYLIEKFIGFRADEKAEIDGLDEAEHGESGYDIAPI